MLRKVLIVGVDYPKRACNLHRGSDNFVLHTAAAVAQDETGTLNRMPQP